MGSRDKTTLTEEHVRRLTDEQSFQRGRKYYADGAVRNPVRQGPEIRAECYGSRHEPYRVKAVLGENGVQAASCTCPRGGFCKHIVALLLAYIHEPEAFREVPALEAMLAALTRDDLVALIVNMVRREPSLLALVERAVAMPPGSSVDAAALRREVERALRHRDPEDIEADLRDLLERAEGLAEKGDWLGAGLVYQEVLAGLAARYGDELQAMDEDGVVAAVAADCVDGLSECLDEFQGDRAARRAWLAALLEAELADIALGGVDFAPGASDVLLDQATEEEWLFLEERVRELIPESRGWKRERLVEILVSWRENHGRHQEARQILREMGTAKQRLFLLVREGKPEEAAALAREHFTEMPGVMIDLARALAEAGAAEHAVALLSELADSKDSHPGYLEWLAEYHRKSGDPERALTWQRQVFLRRPTVKSFEVLREVSEKIGVWQEVRAGVLKELEEKNEIGALVEIALHEGDVARALELLPRAPRGGWRDYRLEVAKAAEKKRPLEAIALYKEMAEAAIAWRQRKAYAQAASFLRRVRLLYERLGRVGEWQEYLAALKKEYARLPALQEELSKAGL